MVENQQRAEITSRTVAPNTFDAGIHAHIEAGTVDIGLSVEPSGVGLIVDAPWVGVLKLAFDVSPDGTTRLSRATRKANAQGDVTLNVFDESRLQPLEQEIVRLQGELENRGNLTTSAHEQISQLTAAREQLAMQHEELKAEVSRVSSLLEQRGTLEESTNEEVTMLVTALSDARSFQAEAEAHSAQLTTELEEAQAHLAAAEMRATEELTRLTGERDDALEQIEALNQTLREARAVVENAAASERSAVARVQHESLAHSETLQIQFAAELQNALATRAHLEAQVQSLHLAADAKVHAETAATNEAREVAHKLKTQAEKLRAERDEARALARQLHQKIAASIPDKELAELRSTLELQKAELNQVTAEKDEWQTRYRELAQAQAGTPVPTSAPLEVPYIEAVDTVSDFPVPIDSSSKPSEET